MTVHLIEQGVKLEYGTPTAPHSMLIPINEISVLGTDQTDTSVLAWDASNKNLEDMVNELVTTFLAFFPIGTFFSIATLLITDPEDEALVPAFSWTLTGMEGEAISPGWYTAVEWTISFRSLDNNVSKLVFLDAGSFDNFNKIISLTGETALAAVIAEYMSLTNGWAARDNTRPATWTQATRTLNEKLRRAYRMV